MRPAEIVDGFAEIDLVVRSSMRNARPPDARAPRPGDGLTPSRRRYGLPSTAVTDTDEVLPWRVRRPRPVEAFVSRAARRAAAELGIDLDGVARHRRQRPRHA